MGHRHARGAVCIAALLLIAASVGPYAHAQNTADDFVDADSDDVEISVSADSPVPIAAAGPAAGGTDAAGPASDLKPRHIRAKVAKDKAAIKQALADPQLAASEYFTRLQSQAADLAAAGRELPYHLSVLQPASGSGPLQAQGVDAAAAATARLQRNRFLDSLDRIAVLNARSGPMLAYGITPFMHLTPEEWRQNYLGGRKKPVAGSGRKLASMAKRQTKTGYRTFKGGSFSYDYTCSPAVDWASSGMASNPLVDSIDWRKQGVITPVRDQGSCGSCVAFSNFAVLEASYIQKWKGSGFTVANTDLSEQEAMNCLGGNQCNGADGYEYIDRSTCQGVSQENAAAATLYKAKDSNRCPKAKVVARSASGVKAYTFVDASADGLRRALYHNPVAIGIAADDPFMYYASGVINCRTGARGGLNHETTIVAYTQTSSSKYFTVKNSWSEGWGAAGYYNIRADCGGLGALQMYDDPFLTLAIRE